MRRSVFLAVIAGAFAAVVSPAWAHEAAKPGSSDAGSDASQANPVVFVHGLNPLGGIGVPCSLNWDPMKDALRDWGWQGELVDTKYYAGDSSCEHSLDHHGSHNAHLGNNKWWTFGFNHALTDTSSHNHDTPIEHVAYHLAWFLYDHYTSQGRTVELVSHSMGGVATRYALTKVEQHHAAFPPSLLVEDSITLETPHDGAYLSFLCGWSTQCLELLPGSGFLDSLGENPQGAQGTDWTAIGSYWDPLVPADSADGMSAAHRVTYSSPAYEHILGLWDDSLDLDGSVDQSEDGGPWQRANGYPHSLNRINMALTSPDQ